MSIKEDLHRLVDLLPEECEAHATSRLRELIEGPAAQPWSSEDRAEWEALVSRIRERVPEGLTADEIGADITAASVEARAERIARPECPRAA